MALATKNKGKTGHLVSKHDWRTQGCKDGMCFQGRKRNQKKGLPKRILDSMIRETVYEPGVLQVVLEKKPGDDGPLPLAEIRRNVRRMAALLQQQPPDFFIDKRLRKPMPVADSWEPTPRSESVEIPGTATPKSPIIEVFVTNKEPKDVEEEDEEDSLPPLTKTPRIQPSKVGSNKPVSTKLPDYKNVRSSLDSKGTRSMKSEFRILQHEKKPSYDGLQGRYKQDKDFKPIRSQNNVTAHSESVKPFKPWEIPDEPPKKTELPKLSTDRLKNLVSRDFSKPPPSPTSRLDPRRQQLSKPASKITKPVDIFKQQVKVNKSMDNMIAMTNYGEADKPDPFKSKPKVPPKEEEKKKPFEVPKELKRAIAPPKLPPIAKPKLPSPPPTPIPPDPTPASSTVSPEPELIEPEESFVIVKDDFEDEFEDEEEEEEEEEEVDDEEKEEEVDSAYCTCDDYLTESEDLKSRMTLTDDGTLSSSVKTDTTCTHCGGKRTRWSSRVPSSIKEKSLIHDDLSQDGGLIDDTPRDPSSPEVIREVTVEEINIDLTTPREPPKPEVIKKVKKHEDFMSILDNIGQFTGIPDPAEKEPTPEPELPRTVLAPKKRQRGVYKDGVREQYIKALAAAEVRRLPAEPWMMLGPRISRAWVFSYFQNIPRPSEEPAPKKPEPEEPKGKKKKKRKRFKAMKHIFGKGVNYDSYFPGMKNNLVLAPITLPPRDRSDPITMAYKKPGQLVPLVEGPNDERSQGGSPELKEHPLTGIETPAKDFRFRNRSRLSSSHSHTHNH